MEERSASVEEGAARDKCSAPLPGNTFAFPGDGISMSTFLEKPGFMRIVVVNDLSLAASPVMCSCAVFPI